MASAQRRASAPGLVVENLTVRFGGATAVNDLTLHAPTGQVTGLIGPNGAGKTTTFNACCGLLGPERGRVNVAGHDVTGSPPHRRAQLGLGRTFQRMELCDSLSVERNIALGREARIAGASPLRHLTCRRADRAAVAAATRDAIDLCGIGNLADRSAGTLSTGQRRLVELARVVAGGFTLLLLDEPSSGLDRAETEAFGHIIGRLADAHGVGILLVEHDMHLVMSVCAELYVLDFGNLIFHGPPTAAQASVAVRDAYLGAPA
jgi:ABC-type branched-subunit amino acid transport system ATPase component